MHSRPMHALTIASMVAALGPPSAVAPATIPVHAHEAAPKAEWDYHRSPGKFRGQKRGPSQAKLRRLDRRSGSRRLKLSRSGGRR